MRYIVKHIASVLFLALCMLVSCDYLDVVPPEQPSAEDTMKDRANALGFINTCYVAVESTSPMGYLTYEWSADEAMNSRHYATEACVKASWNLYSATDAAGHWDACYNYIGYCNQFLDLLNRSNPTGATEEDKTRWRAEIEFLKAYYHFRLLEMYGPIPIMDERMPQSTLPDEFPGRSHFDYVIDYICNQKLNEQTINALPDVGNDVDWGRATKSAALALKGRALLYAASPLWNGKYPQTDWKNTNYETPGYGDELISHREDMSKWDRALEANLEALRVAESTGERQLVDMDNQPSNLRGVPIPYIAGVDTSTVEGKEFARRVLMLRSITSSNEDDGNREIIWGVIPQGNNSWWTMAQCPPRILCYNETDNTWADGWGVMNPTLYSIEHFYTKNGTLPDLDPTFPQGDERLERAGILLPGHENIIKLNVNREPRFYATFSFDGDDYSPLMKDGEPLTVNMLSSEAQGFGWDQNGHNYSEGGYLMKKYISPIIRYSSINGSSNNENWAKPLFRLAELYLNIAECYAAKGETKNALQYLNPIRERAGLKKLTESDVDASGMSITDWVRNERFIELWGEGHRYYDVRRWMLAPQQLRAGARDGLNLYGAGADPTFEEFNKRVVIDQSFQWDNRMYLWPISWTEISNNPQLVQAPGY